MDGQFICLLSAATVEFIVHQPEGMETKEL